MAGREALALMLLASALASTQSCKLNHCPNVDAGTSLPCVGKADGVECCIGAKVGACKAQECVAP